MQTEFHLPPHGPVVFAAEIPDEIGIDFIDENVQEMEFDPSADLAAIADEKSKETVITTYHDAPRYIVTGAATVISAMGAGKRAARGMHEYLNK